MKIQIINGPNLNLLGKREPTIYGNQSFESFLEEVKARFPKAGIEYFQSNSEGALIDMLHSCNEKCDGIVLNAGAYTHTSIALADAIAAITCPVIEVHLSNIAARENFRHTSMIAAKCKGSIAGFGLSSYLLALEYLLSTLPAE